MDRPRVDRQAITIRRSREAGDGWLREEDRGSGQGSGAACRRRPRGAAGPPCHSQVPTGVGEIYGLDFCYGKAASNVPL